MSSNARFICLLFALPAIALAEATGPQRPPPLEIFLDRGESYVRAGSRQGLTVGAELPVLTGVTLGDPVEAGTATVMEVWDSLARVTLDANARAAPEPRFAKLFRSAVVVPPPLSPAPAPSDFGVRVEMGHMLWAKRLILINDTDRPITHCDLRLPDHRHYQVRKLDAKDHETIMLFRFDSDEPPLDLPINQVTVQCAEGQTSLRL